MNEDLPVTVALSPPLDRHVAAWVEQDLGWQVVEVGGPLPPVLALADGPCGPLPWIGVIDGAPTGDDVRLLLTSGATDVVGWPEDRHRIPAVAARIDLGRASVVRSAQLTIAGVAGGVGTSTLALAVGGLLAWSGAAVLVVGGDGLLALAGVDAAVGGTAAPARTHTPVDGVPGLSVARRDADGTASAWSGDVVVVDAGVGVAPDASMVVSRADGGLHLARTSGRPVVVMGDVPLGARDARRLLGRPPLAHLPLSVRVAQAGLRGRVPSAMPGRWLRTLRDGLGRLERVSR